MAWFYWKSMEMLLTHDPIYQLVVTIQYWFSSTNCQHFLKPPKFKNLLDRKPTIINLVFFTFHFRLLSLFLSRANKMFNYFSNCYIKAKLCKSWIVRIEFLRKSTLQRNKEGLKIESENSSKGHLRDNHRHKQYQ